MGALKDLYQKIREEVGTSQLLSAASDAPFTEKLRRDTIRHLVTKALFDLELTLLLNPQQKDALFLSHEEDEDAPFDELEVIVRNNVRVNNHIGKIKECVLDLDEISTTEDAEETKELHRDELSGKVLNMLHRQMAQVLLMTGEDANGQAEWLMKQPKEFIRGVLLGADRQEDAFDDVRFEQDLATADLDCREYLRKSHTNPKWNAIRAEDEIFNRDALKLLKDIRAWETNMRTATGNTLEELKRKKERAENVIAKATNARNSALRDAFRTGDISEYYYRQRSEQLDRRDYSRVPEMFEVDELKDREKYLKSHDLQDLSKSEAEAICALACKRAERERDIYLKKEFLTKRGLCHSRRYLIPEMAINKDIFYRGLAAGNGFCKEEEEEDEVSRISVDLDEPAEDYIGMTMRQVPTAEELARKLKK
ncbi:MAG: hypothetical protein IJ735_06330 [Clostridia bacterium]|nr:hypothetical protein [Clostridia bacterium]